MSQMIRVQAEELAGPALGWAIESIEGVTQPATGQLQLPFCSCLPSDELCEKLIAKYNVWVRPGWSYKWLANAREDRDPCERLPGETRAIAVFRTVVAVKLGSTVSIPVELI